MRRSKLFQTVIRWKVYIDRARGYVSYIQFLMTATIVVKIFNLHIGVLGYVILFVIVIVGCLIVGFADTKLGIWEEEMRNINKRNKEFMAIYKKIKDESTDA